MTYGNLHLESILFRKKWGNSRGLLGTTKKITSGAGSGTNRAQIAALKPILALIQEDIELRCLSKDNGFLGKLQTAIGAADGQEKWGRSWSSFKLTFA